MFEGLVCFLPKKKEGRKEKEIGREIWKWKGWDVYLLVCMLEGL